MNRLIDYHYRKLKYGLAMSAVLLGALVGLLAVTASSALAAITPPGPEKVYALTTSDELLFFDGDQPNQIKERAFVTGLFPGESLVGIDFRPSTNELYGVGDQDNIYIIEDDPNSASFGDATLDSKLTISLKGTHFGVDFDPANDRLRIVSDEDQNLRHNLVNDTTQKDGNLNYVTGDPNAGANPRVTAAAYTQNQPGATGLLYDIDFGLDIGARQEPQPNNGDLTTCGPLGINVTPITGFDVVTTFGAGNVLVDRAYAALQPKGKGTSNLYEFNLTNCSVTKIARIGDKGTRVEGLAIPISQE